MSYLHILRISFVFLVVFLISSCGNKQIIEENSSGSTSQEVNNTELTQEMVDRLTLLESQNLLNEQSVTVEKELIAWDDSPIVEQTTKLPITQDTSVEASPFIENTVSQDKTASIKETQTPKTQNTTTKNTESANINTLEIAPIITPEPQSPVVPEVTINTEITSIPPIATAPLPVEIITPVEKNIIQKVIDVVVQVTKTVIETVKNIVSPQAKTEGIISNNQTSSTPATQTEIVENSPIINSPVGSTTTSTGAQNTNTNSNGNSTQTGSNQTTLSWGTSTGWINQPVIIDTTVPSQSGSLTPELDEATLETSAAIIVQKIDENAGIAQFTQGNFTGLNKSNPVNLTTQNGLSIILYQFSLNQTLTSPTVIVGKVQKNFVFDGLFWVQIYNSNNEKIKDWYATTFFSQDSWDEAKWMVYFLIELIYDKDFPNKTPTGYLRFLVDNPTSNASKDDFIDIPVKFPL